MKKRTFYPKRAWSILYHTKEWDLIRNKQLLKEPYCLFCNTTTSLQVDHIFDHKGNWMLFIDSLNLQTLCLEHHTMKGVLDKYCAKLKKGNWLLKLDFSKQNDLSNHLLLTTNRLKALTKFFNEQEVKLNEIVLYLGGLDLGSQKHLVNLAMRKMNSKPADIYFFYINNDWIINKFKHHCLVNV